MRHSLRIRKTHKYTSAKWGREALCERCLHELLEASVIELLTHISTKRKDEHENTRMG